MWASDFLKNTLAITEWLEFALAENANDIHKMKILAFLDQCEVLFQSSLFRDN